MFYLYATIIIQTCSFTKMDFQEIATFFALCIIDISKLKGINLREFLELRDPPEYYLIVNPAKVEIDKLDNYRVKTIADGQFYIASQIGSEDYYIPEAGYALVNITSKVSGIILNIFGSPTEYVNNSEWKFSNMR